MTFKWKRIAVVTGMAPVLLIGVRFLLDIDNGTPPATPMFVESVYTVAHWGRGHRHFVDPPPVTTLCEMLQSGVQVLTSHTFKNQLSQAVYTRDAQLLGQCSGGFCVVKRERTFEFTFKAPK